jgi:hypothetical protein
MLHGINQLLRLLGSALKINGSVRGVQNKPFTMSGWAEVAFGCEKKPISQ